MYTYQKIINNITKNILDDDTKSIVKKYSIFYIERDYDIIINELKKRCNQKKSGFFNFLCLNNIHYYIFQKCNKELINKITEELSLDDIDMLIKKIIISCLFDNFKILEINISNYYMNNIYDYIHEIYYNSTEKYYFRPIEYTFIESEEYIINILKDFKMTKKEEKKLIKYMIDNIKKYLNSNLDKIYEDYKNNFMNYTTILD